LTTIHIVFMVQQNTFYIQTNVHTQQNKLPGSFTFKTFQSSTAYPNSVKEIDKYILRNAESTGINRLDNCNPILRMYKN
jgi:hypothetical protein